MADYNDILKRVWGFSSFRPMQEEIIRSVLEGRDTLGLLPTGGGKSLTFQVPALVLKGICIVVTPLIALMKDQVNRLISHKIKAAAVFSGMTSHEIDVTLTNCIYGNYKFLYLSPERIGSEIFRERFKQMPVNLVAIDEAHCISQWGYDFRPSYLRIAELRAINPTPPFLALTATATSAVITDIQEKLAFKAPNVFRTSFERQNLVYTTEYTENKEEKLLNLASRLDGCGIVYTRNRKKCGLLAQELKKRGVKADYYHAGLKNEIRTQRQQDWSSGKINVIVATNAFGMGIDKANVRFVIHMDIPDSPEAYFQEAGRAGRDGKEARAIMIVAPSDQKLVDQRLALNFPEPVIIRRVYQAAGNYCQVPYGGGKGLAFDFNLIDFITQYKFQSYVAYSSLKILEMEGYIELTDEVNNPSRIKFMVSRDDLYKFQVANVRFDSFIKLLLRSYSGVFSEYVPIDEVTLAKRSSVAVDIILQYLSKLGSLKIINYIPKRKSPLLIFTEERLEDKSLRISPEVYQQRKARYTERLGYILKYALSDKECRSQQLLRYFGEKEGRDCGGCDACIRRREQLSVKSDLEMVEYEIISILKLEPYDFNALAARMPFSREMTMKGVRWLLDQNKICYVDHIKLGIP